MWEDVFLRAQQTNKHHSKEQEGRMHFMQSSLSVQDGCCDCGGKQRAKNRDYFSSFLVGLAACFVSNSRPKEQTALQGHLV